VLAFVIAVSRPDNPMVKLSKKSCRPEAPAPAVEPALRVASRRKTADQRLRILELLITGLSVVHIARVEKLTVRRVQQIIARHARKPQDRPARRFRPVASRPAQRGDDDRHAYDDAAGRSAGGRQNDPAHARTRSLSRLRTGSNSGAGGAASVDGFDAREADAKFSASQSIEIARSREEISETSPPPK
jgi:hypothetical protein